MSKSRRGSYLLGNSYALRHGLYSCDGLALRRVRHGLYGELMSTAHAVEAQLDAAGIHDDDGDDGAAERCPEGRLLSSRG